MTREKILLILLVVVITMAAGALPISAATYYVKNGGDDSADGLTDATAWKTISKVNSETFSPADTICFKRGDTWRIPIDAQLIPRSGSSAGYITYSAYDKGPKPLFLGSVEKNSPSDWTLTGTPNIWATANNSFILDIGNIIFNNEKSCGHKVWNSSSLKSQGDFYYDGANERLLLYSAANPAAYYSDIECAVKKHIVAVVDKSYVTISNLDLRYGAAHGIQGRNTSYITIQDCDISYIGGGHQKTQIRRRGRKRHVRYGNAIELWESAHDILVQRNRIRQIYDNAITNQSGNERGISQYNINFRYNVIWNTEIPYVYFTQNPATVVHDIYVENNTIVNTGYGWSHTEAPRPRAWALKFWGTMGTVSNFYVRNNIIYESKNLCLSMNNPQPGKIMFNYNCWYKASGNMIKYGRSAYSMADFPAYQANTGQDANSIAADPAFVDLAGGNYKLQDSSPCIDKGLDIGLTQDFNYNPIVPPCLPDIGAFELTNRKQADYNSKLTMP